MASTSSITSKYASLFVYFTELRLHGIALSWPEGSVPLTLHKLAYNFYKVAYNTVFHVTYFDLPVTVFAIVLNILGGLINSLRMLLSVANGKPLSSISSNNS